MLVHRLRLVNFRQHEDTDLRFGPGLTGVMGPNGAGKSTLLEALAWALYGTRAARGTAEGIRRRSAPPRARVEVTLEFALGAHRYRVVRSLHGAELFQDGDPAPLANSGTAVTDRVTRLLGMSREEFFNTYFTQQKDLTVMRDMGGVERERFLSRVLGYERLGTVQKRLAAERTVLRARLEALESTLASPADLDREGGEAADALAAAGAAAAAAAAAPAAASASAASPPSRSRSAGLARVDSRASSRARSTVRSAASRFCTVPSRSYPSTRDRKRSRSTPPMSRITVRSFCWVK